jgi:hypothetical protein
MRQHGRDIGTGDIMTCQRTIRHNCLICNETEFNSVLERIFTFCAVYIYIIYVYWKVYRAFSRVHLDPTTNAIHSFQTQ